MTILPKKKTSQQKTESESTDSNNHSYPVEAHAHQNHTQEGRERFGFTNRSSPPSWSSHASREEKRPARPPSAEYSNADTGPSHSKRRHQTSPHRCARKARTHSNHPHRANTSISLPNPGPSYSQSSHATSSDRKLNNAQNVDPDNNNEDPSGYNSGDEYDRNLDSVTPEEMESKEKQFEDMLVKKGYSIKKMGEDGACMFRAVADQIYGDQEMHGVVRKLCMDYMAKNSDHYSQYVTEDFQKYLERKRCEHIHGNHVEMQALSEMFNRQIEVYHYSTEPINIFHCKQDSDNEPIRLSYHRNVHYNSIVDPYKATVGVGLGLPSFKPDHVNKTLITDAIRASENLELEQAMLEDKLRASDWEATNEAIEEQVARESYLQWLRENECRARKTPTRTATATSSSCLVDPVVSGGMSPQSGARLMPRNRGGSASSSPNIHETFSGEKETKSPESPKAETSGFSSGAYAARKSPTADAAAATVTQSPLPCASSASSSLGFSLIETASFMDELPPSVFGLTEWEDSSILAKVLAESQQEYIESLKKRSAMN